MRLRRGFATNLVYWAYILFGMLCLHAGGPNADVEGVSAVSGIGHTIVCKKQRSLLGQLESVPQQLHQHQQLEAVPQQQQKQEQRRQCWIHMET